MNFSAQKTEKYTEYQTQRKKNDGQALEPKLLQLPAELRIEIYRLVLLAPIKIELSDSIAPKEPALLAVSKQIRREGQQFY